MSTPHAFVNLTVTGDGYSFPCKLASAVRTKRAKEDRTRIVHRTCMEPIKVRQWCANPSCKHSGMLEAGDTCKGRLAEDANGAKFYVPADDYIPAGEKVVANMGEFVVQRAGARPGLLDVDTPYWLLPPDSPRRKRDGANMDARVRVPYDRFCATLDVGVWYYGRIRLRTKERPAAIGIAKDHVVLVTLHETEDVLMPGKSPAQEFVDEAETEGDEANE